MSDPTVIPERSVTQITQELVAVYPSPWTSDAAKLPGGILYAVMNAFAGNLQMINDFLVYGFDSSRIATAENDALDLVSVDFYGTELPRKRGESDDAFRGRIQAQMFIPYTTRDAFIQAITALTGTAPRLISPWIAGQTSGFDWSYWDYDTEDRPALYGDSSLKYQAFIQATLPSPTQPDAPSAIWGYDAGAGFDLYTGTFWNLLAADFVTVEDLDKLINRIKAFGITIWRKYLSQGSLPFPIPQYFSVSTGAYLFPINIQQFNGPFVVIASTSWNTEAYVFNVSTQGFTIETNTASPSGAFIEYVILPVSLPGAGFIGCSGGELTGTLPVPQLPATSSNRVAISPSWNTTVWIDTLTSSTMTIAYSNPPSAGDTVSYYFFPNGQSATQYIPLDQSEYFISVPGLVRACPFATANWNTTIALEMGTNGFLLKFGTAAPVGGFVTWGYFPLQ